jgi:hypothetical protein
MEIALTRIKSFVFVRVARDAPSTLIGLKEYTPRTPIPA